MILVRENKQKKRRTYRLDDRYRKVWDIVDTDWLKYHTELLEKVVPGYVLGSGSDGKTMWIDYTIVPGIPASELPHTDEFIKQIYKFCLENIQSTQPYVHGDWVLSNIIINGDKIHMCDWDNVSIRTQEEALEKLHRDLESAFGNKFVEVIR